MKIKKLLIGMMLALPLVAVTVLQRLPLNAAPGDFLFKTLDARDGLTSSHRTSHSSIRVANWANAC